jgi:hypothetical protein
VTHAFYRGWGVGWGGERDDTEQMTMGRALLTPRAACARCSRTASALGESASCCASDSVAVTVCCSLARRSRSARAATPPFPACSRPSSPRASRAAVATRAGRPPPRGHSPRSRRAGATAPRRGTSARTALPDIRELLNREDVTLEHVPTQRNVADILTKALARLKHCTCMTTFVCQHVHSDQ